MKTKDYFSGHSRLYATFRPTYPANLYEFIFQHLKKFDAAWDCATGNGQVARVLAKHFIAVHATDISQEQLDHAFQARNIHYSVQPAEKTQLPDRSVDLVTVGQALHWLDLEKFYNEVRRVARNEAMLAVWGYARCSVNPLIDEHFLHFYNHVVGPYWDNARKLVDDEYRNVPFPFEQIQAPKFSIQVNWTLEEFAGYLTTWSATQKFMKEKVFNPVPELIDKIRPLWLNGMLVTFPVFLRLGRIG
jgi:ubiquinone/menaquinone biosynthesis C-methylase UbiE